MIYRAFTDPDALALLAKRVEAEIPDSRAFSIAIALRPTDAPVLDHSARSAVSGSTRLARRAGR